MKGPLVEMEPNLRYKWPEDITRHFWSLSCGFPKWFCRKQSKNSAQITKPQKMYHLIKSIIKKPFVLVEPNLHSNPTRAGSLNFCSGNSGAFRGSWELNMRRALCPNGELAPQKVPVIKKWLYTKTACPNVNIWWPFHISRSSANRDP